jgi:ribonuclease HI
VNSEGASPPSDGRRAPHGALLPASPRIARAKPALERSVSGADVVVYTDGACRTNPGPGGWAALIFEGADERIVTGAEAQTTNQRMELRAAIEGLAAISGTRDITVYTDSLYVMRCFVDRWWARWERNGWMATGGKPVSNRDLWERLIAETRRHDVTWQWVKGHSGHPLNDRVDLLARQAIAAADAR